METIALLRKMVVLPKAVWLSFLALGIGFFGIGFLLNGPEPELFPRQHGDASGGLGRDGKSMITPPDNMANGTITRPLELAGVRGEIALNLNEGGSVFLNEMTNAGSRPPELNPDFSRNARISESLIQRYVDELNLAK